MIESPALAPGDAEQPVRRLDVLHVFNQTWLEVFRCRLPLLKALLVPSVLLVALDYLDALYQAPGTGSNLIIGLVALLVWATFAVSCHRILLIETGRGAEAWGLYLSRQAIHYFGYTVLFTFSITLFLIGANLLIALIFETPVRAPPNVESIFETVRMVVEILLLPWVLYMVARFALILPAKALGVDAIMEDAWSWSRNNGWRLLLAIVMPTVSVVIVLLPIIWLKSEFAHPLMAVPLAIAANLVCAACVASISCSYKALRPHDDATMVAEPAAEPVTTIA